MRAARLLNTLYSRVTCLSRADFKIQTINNQEKEFGIITMRVPKEMVIWLARFNKSTNYFEAVHVIERAESLYNLHSNELAQLGGGRSATAL